MANLSTRTKPEVVQARYTLPCVWPRKFSSSRNWLADTERGAKCNKNAFRLPLFLYLGLGSVHQTNVESVTCKQTMNISKVRWAQAPTLTKGRSLTNPWRLLSDGGSATHRCILTSALPRTRGSCLLSAGKIALQQISRLPASRASASASSASSSPSSLPSTSASSLTRSAENERARPSASRSVDAATSADSRSQQMR